MNLKIKYKEFEIELENYDGNWHEIGLVVAAIRNCLEEGDKK